MVWNAPFEANFRRQYENWMLHGEKETTAAGNPRSAPMMEYLGWLLKAWNDLLEEIIVDSFKCCGITTSVDGSEDGQIHCFKPDGPIPEGSNCCTMAKLQE